MKSCKEYLDSNRNYEFVLSTEKDDGFIEIPEGANIAVLSLNGFIVFYKDNNSDVFYATEPGVDFSFKWELGGNGVGNREIIWQREQDEPFLTPECTLNDQYAEIEQVRQDGMKEYLIPSANYKYQKAYPITSWREWVEIPNGAEWAKLWDKGESYECVEFYRGENEFFNNSSKKWMRGADQSTNKIGQPATIIWNRQSLNSAETLQGTVKAEPDLNFGAAQANGAVDATLAERQSQYGCYEDVAHVTQQILSALRIGNYDKLPAPMKESLHMIASKMARIVNGDPEYLDNWHDIGGYAKLIEKLIKGE